MQNLVAAPKMWKYYNKNFHKEWHLHILTYNLHRAKLQKLLMLEKIKKYAAVCISKIIIIYNIAKIN